MKEMKQASRASPRRTGQSQRQEHTWVFLFVFFFSNREEATMATA